MRRPLALGAIAAVAVVAIVAAYFIAPRNHLLFPPRATNGTEYVLYVSVPEACRGNPCTALYLLDGERWLPTFARAAQRLPEPIIIVGIGYRDVLRTAQRRKFDFTPAFGREPGQTGGAEAYLSVLRDEIIPYAEAQLPIDPSERAIAGHSYAGLFTTYAFASEPSLFNRYLIMSPALWFDKGAVYEIEFVPGDGPRSVFVAADTPEGEARSDMARDVLRLADVLSTHFSAISSAIYVGETHDSMVAPAARDGLGILYGPPS